MAGNLSVQFDLIPKLDLTAIKAAMPRVENHLSAYFFNILNLT